VVNKDVIAIWQLARKITPSEYAEIFVESPSLFHSFFQTS